MSDEILQMTIDGVLLDAYWNDGTARQYDSRRMTLPDLVALVGALPDEQRRAVAAVLEREVWNEASAELERVRGELAHERKLHEQTKLALLAAAQTANWFAGDLDRKETE